MMSARARFHRNQAVAQLREEDQQTILPKLLSENHRFLGIRSMQLKNRLRQIKTNCANFIHGRLLFSGVSTPPLWHIDAVRGGRPPHRFE
jgi:hypothetical protein